MKIILFFIIISYITAIEPRCGLQCEQLLFYNCRICYSECGQTAKFSSCSRGAFYKNYMVSSEVINNHHLNETECMRKCCAEPSGTFNYENLFLCKITNEKRFETVLLAFIMFMMISIGFMCLVIKCRRVCCCCRREDLNDETQHANQMVATLEDEELHWERDKLVNWKILNNSSTCAICLEKDVNTITKCEHVFHLECIWNWAKKKGRCPVCKNSSPNPYKFYCRSCSLSYVKVRLYRNMSYNMEWILEVMGGERCPRCKQAQQNM